MNKQSITLADSGFFGSFSSADKPAQKAVIVLTGSDGGLAHAEYLASRFAAKGIAALAVAYFNVPDLNKTLNLIPIEYIESAVKWLKSQTGLETVAVYGVSKGAEYALMASTLIADIDCVVAVVPNYYVAEGIGAGKSRTGNSSWSYRGRPLPYAPVPGGTLGLAGSVLRHGQLEVSLFYRLAEKNGIPDNARIPVEQSHARILLFSSGMDSVWPSKRAGEVLSERLRAADYPYAFRHRCFAVSSHFLEPIPAGKAKLARLIFKAERQHPKECEDARQEAFAAAVDWIKHPEGYVTQEPITK